MNEISRCCRLLGVKTGMSLEEVKKVYRDLVQVWHPDRFQGNERLAVKAQEQLKEINLAYEFLVTNAFQDGVLVEPPEEPTSFATVQTASDPATEPAGDSTDVEAEESEPAGSHKSFWVICGVVLILAGGSALFLHSRGNTRPAASPPPTVSDTSSPAQSNSSPASPADRAATAPARSAPQSASLFPFSQDVVSTFSATNGPKCFETPYLLSPPFSIRATVAFTNNLPPIIFFYGLGRVIFNWSDHPDQLRVHDPRNWNVTPVSGQGMILPNAPHELVWTIQTDGMSVSVDGQIRFQTKANFEKVKGYPGFGPVSSRDILQGFVVDTPVALRVAEPAGRDHAPITNDILSSLVPEKSNQAATRPDGVVVWSAGDSDNRLMSSQTFQPPFIIRTRAKTDALNLRLYCGNGEVILNWERDLHELRVHDPLNGAQVGIRDQGLVSANEWHAIIWEVQPTGMNVFVDGQLRFQKRNDYRKLNARVGIGPAQSRITVDYFQVEKK